MTHHTFTGAQRLPLHDVEMCGRRHFLSAADCAALTAQIDARRRPSGLADQNGDPDFRTSETCDLDGDDPLVADIARRLAAFAGLDPAHAEPLQGQRYDVGQQFKPHTDYFEPGAADYDTYCAVSGQRTWTMMIYLNEPAAGGGTWFTVQDKVFQPETGKLLAWNNRRADGSPNPATLHAGMPVRRGMKYIITGWFRERPWPAITGVAG